MSQAAKPTGFIGKTLAKGMARGHKVFYENTAKVLDLKPDDRFLEIGFGAGLFIKRYASNVSRIAGIDISGDMVELASSINKDLIKSGKVELKQGDVASLPWDDNEFSVVVVIETFFFWPEPLKSLKEIFRVLAPGGRLVIEMAFNKDDGLDHTKHIKKYEMRLYSAEEMKQLLTEAGFSEVEIHYFKAVKMPFKGYIVPRGMILKAVNRMS